MASCHEHWHETTINNNNHPHSNKMLGTTLYNNKMVGIEIIKYDWMNLKQTKIMYLNIYKRKGTYAIPKKYRDAIRLEGGHPHMDTR